MRSCYLGLLTLLFPFAYADAQPNPLSPAQAYVGYSYLSNAFNGVPGARQPLNGWNAAIAFPDWRHLHFKLDYSMYRGSNLGNPQHAFFILGGGQYERTFRREHFYLQALMGEGGLNGSWYRLNTAGYKNSNTGTIASLSEFLGGGIDTPLRHRTAFRVEGGVQHGNFVPIQPLSQGGCPYHLAGVPNYFGRFSAGIVWLSEPGIAVSHASDPPLRRPVESERIFESMTSIGHFHLFANSWWSKLSVAGVEYDRHSWGRWVGARRDYSAEMLPLVLLRQPSKTDIWGNPQSATFKTVPGVAILPIGVRLLWMDTGRWMPYYVVKAGMTVYSEKAFSQYASYVNFGLNQSLGAQVRLSDRIDFRAGVGVFHQSNGFIVPSNPGLDALNSNIGLSYHPNRSAGTN